MKGTLVETTLLKICDFLYKSCVKHFSFSEDWSEI